MTTTETASKTNSSNPSKIQTVVIDTINEIISQQVMKQWKDKGKANFDDWRDYGVDMFSLVNYLKTLPNCIPISILGYESTGKTVGAASLNPNTTIYLNCDNKPLTFLGGRVKYNKEKKNYFVPKTYDEIENIINSVYKNKLNTDPFFVFVLAHIESYKAADGSLKERMRIPGKVAHKYNIDGSFVHTYYTTIENDGKDYNDASKYQLVTANSEGTNTARSPMGLWDSLTIPNNYQLIIDNILEKEYGIMPNKSE